MKIYFVFSSNNIVYLITQLLLKPQILYALKNCKYT